MTPPAFKLLAPKNNATTAKILGTIGAGDTTIAMQSGGGATLPTVQRGVATSTGDKRTLNDTGDLAALTEGQHIYNLTDGSNAVIIETGTDSIRTTPLEGGSDNTWQNGDVWVVGMFVVNFIHFNTAGEVTKRERVLVHNKVSETLTVVRGFDGDVSYTFDDGDSVQLLLEETEVESIHAAIGNIYTRIDGLYRNKPFSATTTGSSNAYAATLPITITTYSDLTGVPITLIANFAVTGAATININGLGNKNIYKPDGATALTTDEIKNGQMFMLAYNGSAFCLISNPSGGGFTMPAGVTVAYTGSSAPTGALLCYGQAVSRSTYATLFGIQSTAYGTGDGSTTFNMPDLRGRFPLGKDDMGGSSANRVTATQADNLGQGSGAETHTLTTPEMPSHNHSFNQQIKYFGSSGAGLPDINVSDSDGSDLTIGNTGGGGAHNNMPPYQTFNWITFY